jgi:hypothetical protein
MSMMPSKIKIICWCCQLSQCVLVATLTSIKNLLLFSFRSQLTQRYLQVLCNKEESFGKIQDVCVTVLPSKFEGRVLNFSPPAAQKVVWIGREGDSGAGLTLQHHSLDSYGGHEMIQQHLTLWNASKQHQFCPKFDGRVLNFSPPAAQKVVWIGREGDSGAGLTLQHHSLDSYGGHEMVQQHLTL